MFQDLRFWIARLLVGNASFAVNINFQKLGISIRQRSYFSCCGFDPDLKIQGVDKLYTGEEFVRIVG